MISEYGREGEGERRREDKREKEGDRGREREREKDLTRSTQYRYTDGFEDFCACNGRNGGDLADCRIGRYSLLVQ